MKPETLVGKTPNLTAPSPTVTRLLQLLTGPDVDYDEVVGAVARDPVLTAKLLALCNSASFGLAKPMASIKQAVAYLGYCETLRLVMALNFGDKVNVELPGYAMEPGALWNHSLVTALLSSHVLGLSRKIDADGSVAYTAGLVHDIGKVVIGQMLDAEMRDQIQAILAASDTSLIDAEKRIIGCDHAEIGACLLRQWRLPEIIVEATAHHHAPALAGGPQLSAAIHVADAIAHQTGDSPGWGSFAITIHAEAVTALNLSQKDLNTLTFVAVESAEKVKRHGEAAMVEMPDLDLAACVF
jgi:putative nucleotidyltransferase with HDIG domain